MTEAESLLAIVAAIYVADCAQWAPLDAVILTAPWARRFRVCFPSFTLGNHQGALVWGNPFVPLGPSLLTQSWPLALSPTGALAYSARAINPSSTPFHTERYVAWDDNPQISVQDRTLLVDAQPFLKACSCGLALRLARLMRRVADTPSDQRAKLIEAAIARRAHLPTIRRRWLSYRGRTRSLQWACNVFWAYFFVGGALLVWWSPMRHMWLGLLLGLASLIALTIGLFRDAYRRIHRVQPKRWRGHAAMMLFSPMEAIRGYDLVSREAFAFYDPLAVAAVLCPREETAQLARRIVCDRAHPLPQPEPLGPMQADTWQWFDARCDEQLSRLLAELELSSDTLSAPPDPVGDDCRTYCPRCETQFSLAAGACDPCGGTLLLPLTR